MPPNLTHQRDCATRTAGGNRLIVDNPSPQTDRFPSAPKKLKVLSLEEQTVLVEASIYRNKEANLQLIMVN